MSEQKVLTVGSHRFEWGSRTYVMGILNVTPDSFSDGGRYNDIERALLHAKRLVEEGADILDIGGESTRPCHTPVSAEEEMERVVPVIERIAKEIPIPISIDTYKASVAREAVKAGAHIVNDVWGLKADPEMASVCASLGVPVIVMHNRDVPLETNVFEGWLRETMECVRLAKAAGIPDERIIIDPGVGFGKTYEQNLWVLRDLRHFRELGYPLLLGTSRKSVIGLTLNLPVTERVEGTAATVALGIAGGADIVRVHDVREMVRVARMSDAIVRFRA
ncbi:dihydropteroate synthase [Collibacillus ludicampi]|uniref:Dihydropteroate synthase n=1 Tax=Collibacillus ludicampi TaxID=2771369 RepID=A0AAV4LF54_9BACL|nr:dihydropteroate synthase [Collibacillus ludicampi]